MDAELKDIKLPSFPTGSYNFIRRLRCENGIVQTPPLPAQAAATKGPIDVPESYAKLNVAIIGAGVCGLANAIALALDGHDVTVYEQASKLSEVGAGIQIPPNSSRILHSWGLEEALERRSVKPNSVNWRRWENGALLGRAKLGTTTLEKFGSPYYVTHRAHLHDVLHQRVVELGIPVMLNHRVQDYDYENAQVTFADGSSISADLVIAADGLKSTARRGLNGDKDTGPWGHGLAAYRCMVSMADIRADPLTKPIADDVSLNMWVGHNRHVMAYAIAGGELYNMVLTHPQSSTEIRNLEPEEILADVREHFRGWDPRLTRMLEHVTQAVEWPILCINIPEVWSSKSGRTIISGDAAHAMTPYMAVGAAMAVEDAAALALALRHLSDRRFLPDIIGKWVDTRKPRVQRAHEASLAHGPLLHFADGPLQEARDKAMLPELDSESILESPNQWNDPTVKDWLYNYDAVRVMNEQLKKAV